MDEGRTFLAEFVCRNEYPPHKRIGLTVKIVETTYILFEERNYKHVSKRIEKDG